MSKKYVQKSLTFDACSHDATAGSQQRPAASELITPSPKKVGIENIKVKRIK